MCIPTCVEPLFWKWNRKPYEVRLIGRVPMVEGRDTGFRADWSQEATTRVDGAGTKGFVYVMVGW